MVFKELADLVLLNVNGGQFTSEAAVQRPEVNSYIPVAAHKALQEHVFLLHQERRAERNASGLAGALLDGSFYTTYVLNAIEDATRKAKYLELPGVVQSIPGILSIESVFPTGNPAAALAIVAGPSFVLGIGDAMPCCWHEIHSDKTRIYLDGMSAPCELVVRACMEIDPCLDEAALAIPRAFEQRILAYCIDFFRPQRQTPADGLIDNHDINAVTQKQQ